MTMKDTMTPVEALEIAIKVAKENLADAERDLNRLGHIALGHDPSKLWNFVGQPLTEIIAGYQKRCDTFNAAIAALEALRKEHA